MKDTHNVSDDGQHSASGTRTSLSLLRGVQAMDPDAWRQLALLYGPVVYRWCRLQGLQARDAEDLVQEVFLTVANRVGEFDHDKDDATFRGWLWTITRHKLGDWIRRQRNHPVPVGDTEALQSPEAAPTAGDDVGSLYHRALELIRGEFEQRSWDAFWRVVGEGQGVEDVAAALQMSRNAVYIAKSRILHRLRELLGDL